MDSLLQDFRYGLRMLAKAPRFTVVAVVTLALGIGASTAMFSVVNVLVLRELPVRDPGRLVSFYTTNAKGDWAGITVLQLEELERAQKVFSGVFGRVYPNNSNVEERGDMWPINLGEVTGEYYSVLGVRPALGRLIRREDAGISQGSGSAVAVLSYNFWKRHYAGERDVVGKTILIAQKPFTVIGVTPPGFFGEQVGFALDVTIPITEVPTVQGSAWGGPWCQYGVGRLRDGITFEQARAQLDAIWLGVRAAAIPTGASAAQADAVRAAQLRVEAYPKNGFSYLRDQFAKPVLVLLGIAGLVPLIACVNLATLLLARASARQHEMGVRVALGASRWRLMRQLLTESLLLSAAGAAIGFVFADRAGAWLVSFWSHIAFNPPTAIDVRIDFRVFAFTLAIAIAAAIFFGVAPAWHASRGALANALQEGGRAGGGNARRFGRVLITGQVALSLALVTTGALLVRSLEKLRDVRPGFNSRNIAILQLEADAGGQKVFDDAYYENLVRELSELPGVQSTALSQMLPGSGFGGTDTVDRSGARNATGVEADSEIVSPQFFQTLEIPFVRGRDLGWQDNERTRRVAVISESLAEKLFPSGNSIGRDIRIGSETQRQSVEVIGVVRDARVKDIREASPFAVYVPFLQEPEYIGYWTNVEMRAQGRAGTILEEARQRIDSMGQQYVFNSGTLEGIVDGAIANERAMAFVSGFFSALALLIAAIGLQGLMSYTVKQRTREIGVRMALGAQPRDVLRMVIGEGMLLAGVGIVLGIAGALALGGVVQSLLFEIKPTDLPTFVSVAIALALVALAACYIPARRAMCVDPMVALRYE
jgi:putative ABC transport system permease protein